MTKSQWCRVTVQAACWSAVLAGCDTQRTALARTAGEEAGPALSTTVPGWHFRRAAAVGGSDAGPEELVFGVIGDVVEDGDGRFYVLNFGDKRLMAFDRTGRRLWSAGREGRGPGEFRAPAAAAVVGDGVYVLDAQSGGLSRFRRADGSYVGSVALERRHGFAMDLKSGDGRTVVVQFEPVQGMQPGSRPRLMSVALPSGRATLLAQLDTLVQMAVRVRQGQQRVERYFEPPFSPRPVWSAAGDGSVLFGNGALYEVYRGTPQGPRTAFRASGQPQRVSAADRAAYMEANPLLDSARVQVRFPATKPFYSGMHADPRGGVWLRVPSTAPGQLWEVRDASGRKLGEVRVPAKTRIAGISRTSIYLVELDDDEVETVHRFARSDRAG